MKFSTRHSIYGPIRVAQFSKSEDKLLSLKESKAVAAAVKYARHNLQISISVLALELNMKASALKNFESGKTRCRQLFWSVVKQALARIGVKKMFNSTKPLTKNPK